MTSTDACSPGWRAASTKTPAGSRRAWKHPTHRRCRNTGGGDDGHDRHTTKGGHADAVAVAAELAPYLDVATPASKADLGDPFDPMGAGFVRHHNAYEKTVQSWFGGCNVVKVPRTRKVDIVPIEVASSGVQALRVRMSPLLCPTGITSCEYVVEYRQPIGFDGLRGGPNGVYVHVGNVGSFVRSTHLLDMTPATSSMADSALPVGSTFTDPDGIAIKVVAADAAHATIQVTVPGGSGAATCLDGSTY